MKDILDNINIKKNVKKLINIGLSLLNIVKFLELCK